MSVLINSWEDGGNEGRFETVAEAEAYVLENEMDVVVYDYTRLSGQGYRFNAEIADGREARREKAIATAKEEDAKTESALAAMVRKLDARNKRTSSGYVTKRDELIAILQEVSKHVSVSIVENELPYAIQHKDISVTIKLSLTLERNLL